VTAKRFARGDVVICKRDCSPLSSGTVGTICRTSPRGGLIYLDGWACSFPASNFGYFLGHRDQRQIQTLTLTIGFDGEERTFTYAALVGDKDPMEMTLGEWMGYPALSATAMFKSMMSRYSSPSPRE